MHRFLDINGEPPSLDGKRCQAFLVRQFWYNDQLEEPANIIYLCFDELWYRLYFDAGIIFWRSHEGPPEPWLDPAGEGSFPLVDLGKEAGVQGKPLHSYQMNLIEQGSCVVFGFEGGGEVRFENVNDVTTYAHGTT